MEQKEQKDERRKKNREKQANEIGEGKHPQLPQASYYYNGSDVRHRDANKIVLSKKPTVLMLRSRVITFH